MAVSERPYRPSTINRIAALGFFVLCLSVGIVSGLSPYVGAGIIVVGFAFGISLLLGGPSAAFVLAPVSMSFVLLNRFDQSFALRLDGNLITVNYWLVTLASLALFTYVMVSREQLGRVSASANRFASRFFVGSVVFAALGVFTIFSNSLFDVYVPERSVAKEILALGLICVPMGLACFIPETRLTKGNVLLCLHFIMVLGVATAAVMILFAVMSDVFLGLLGWTTAIGGTIDLSRGRVPLGHPNTVAAILLLLLPIPVILGLQGKGISRRPAYMICTLILIGGVIFSLSRAAAAVMIVLLLAMLLHSMGTSRRQKTIVIVFVLFFVAVILAGGAILVTQFDFSRYWSSGFYEMASLEHRFTSLTTAFAVWRDHFFLGASPNSVYPRDEINPDWVPAAIEFGDNLVVYRGLFSAHNPHNIYMSFLAEFGLFGGGVMFSLLALIGITLYRVRRLPGIADYDKLVLTALGFGFLSILMSGMTGVLFAANLRVGIVFWIFVGLAMRYAVLVENECHDR